MPRIRITDRWLKSIRTDRRTEYWDDLVTGFGVRVSPERPGHEEPTRTFYARSRTDGKRHAGRSADTPCGA